MGLQAVPRGCKGECEGILCGGMAQQCVSVCTLAAGKLHVQGVAEECRSLLERLGGVRGIATKLCSNVDAGINADDIIERVEA